MGSFQAMKPFCGSTWRVYVDEIETAFKTCKVIDKMEKASLSHSQVGAYFGSSLDQVEKFYRFLVKRKKDIEKVIKSHFRLIK